MQVREFQDIVRTWFSTTEALTRVYVMTKAATQTEAWWKVELMLLLEDLRLASRVRKWDSEVSTGEGNKKLDFIVDLGAAMAAIELKTAFCGKQKDTKWTLPNYVGGEKDGYILTDAIKLAAFKHSKPQVRCFQLIVAYPAQNRDAWMTMLTKLRDRLSGRLPARVDLADLALTVNNELSIGWLELA